MHTIETDVAILRAGTAGSRRAVPRSRTPRVLVIEPGPHGTTCARVGCMPSKLLIAAAEAAHVAREAGPFGVRVSGVEVDGEAVMARVRAERDRFVGFVTGAVDAWPAGQLLAGRARFVGPGLLQVDDHTRVKAGRVVLATGSSPRVPAAWRHALGDRLIVNDDVFEWRTLPRSVAVFGAGVIALELAQALSRLGVRVQVYARGHRIGPLTDPALQAEAARWMGHEVPITPQADPIALHREGDEVVVRCGDGPEARFEWALAAIGRQPNVEGLGLAEAGLTLDAHGVPRFDPTTMRCDGAPVFIAGDVDDRLPLLHEAADEGRIAGDNAGRFPDVRARPRRAPLAVVFTDPQMAIAGASHAQLLRQDASFDTGTVSFEDQGRSRVMRRNRGRLHVYGERGTGRLLGAEMIGPDAEHLGHLLAWSVQRGDTVQRMLDSPFYHPVVEEGLRTALRELQALLRLGPAPVEHCLDCGPGT